VLPAGAKPWLFNRSAKGLSLCGGGDLRGDAIDNAFGVPAGAINPFQDTNIKSRTPDSMTVGTPGTSGARVSLDTQASATPSCCSASPRLAKHGGHVAGDQRR
jgi:hypothetical protein